LAELEQELADLRRSPRSASVASRINDLLGTDFTVSWTFERKADRHRIVDLARSSVYVTSSYFETLSQGLQSGKMGFLFSLRVVDPSQRNRPVMFGGEDFGAGLARLERRLNLDTTLREGYLTTLDLMHRHGVREHQQLRTLLCDGSLVIGYVNSIQPAPFTARQRRLIVRVVAALRKRLLLEHRIASCNFSAAALDATLEAIGGAALILDREHNVLHANCLGERALQSEPGLREAFPRIPDRTPDGYEVIPISVAGSPQAHLLIKRSAELADLAATFSDELALGVRARDVFMLAAAGEPNKAIATRLGLAENTVEYHLGVVFRRLGIGSRAELFQLLLERALKAR
jgi:DNA-binding CsgD family transcriptional regulator